MTNYQDIRERLHPDNSSHILQSISALQKSNIFHMKDLIQILSMKGIVNPVDFPFQSKLLRI